MIGIFNCGGGDHDYYDNDYEDSLYGGGDDMTLRDVGCETLAPRKGDDNIFPDGAGEELFPRDVLVDVLLRFREAATESPIIWAAVL